MTRTLDVETMQQALDALIAGDHIAAASQFTDDVVVTGVGGSLHRRTTGIPAALDRYAAVSRLTHGTFGTEVEAVYTGDTTQLVAIVRHWALIDGEQIYGTQALLVTTDGSSISTIDALSRPGQPSGVWD